MIWVYVLSSYVAIGLALTLIFAIVIVIQEALVLNVIKMAFGFPYWLLYLFLKVLAYLKSIYQLGHRIAYQADLYRYGFASWSELATVKGCTKRRPPDRPLVRNDFDYPWIRATNYEEAYK